MDIISHKKILWQTDTEREGGRERETKKIVPQFPRLLHVIRNHLRITKSIAHAISIPFTTTAAAATYTTTFITTTTTTTTIEKVFFVH